MAKAKSKAPQPSKRAGRTPAKPPPVPRATTPARVSIQLADARLVAQSAGELVFSTADASAFVDAKRWPPRVVVHRNQHVRYAARGHSGWWIVYTPRDATWVLRTFAKITAEQHDGDEPEPVPARDFAPLYAGLDEPRRRAELADGARIESLDVCYEFVVVVPRHVGLGEQRHPYVRRRGIWAEDRSLPPLDKPLADVTATHPTRSAEIVDGPWVVVWNNHIYVPLQNEFVELFPASVAFGGNPCAPVSAPSEGVFALRDSRLVEVHIDSVREHLPGVRVRRFQSGPGTTLIVESDGGPLLYNWSANEVVELGALAGDSQIVGVTKTGALLLFDPSAGDLRRLMPRQLAKLPRRHADAAPEASPEVPVAVLDTLGAASRPTIAAVGDLIVIVTEHAVRFWNLDIPLAKAELPAIAVGLRGRRAAVLDARGMLHEVEADTASVIRSHPVVDHPRSLAGARDEWIVIGRDQVVVAGAGEPVRIDVAGAIAAAADPGGAIVIVAEGRRLALWERGELFDIPESAEQLVAIAPLGGRRFVCAGQRNLFVLDLAQRELEALYEQNATPFIAVSPNGKLVAFATSSSVTVAAITGTTLQEVESAHYPKTYTEPQDEPMFVCGLGFLDDDRVGIALTKGRGNVLDVVHKKTKKLDPHPGDTRTRWLFTFATKILVAEDP